MGEVDALQMDENNWTIVQVDVALTKEMEHLFDIKSGMLSKSLIPLPTNLMGPITADRIILKETIEDQNNFLSKSLSTDKD